MNYSYNKGVFREIAENENPIPETTTPRRPVLRYHGDATLYLGDCLEAMQMIDAGSVQCVVTSPPYWRLRDYGVDGQIGLEDTPEEYVEKMVDVFREVRRVLRDDGTVWLNLGSSYASGDMNPIQFPLPSRVRSHGSDGRELQDSVASDPVYPDYGDEVRGESLIHHVRNGYIYPPHEPSLQQTEMRDRDIERSDSEEASLGASVPSVRASSTRASFRRDRAACVPASEAADRSTCRASSLDGPLSDHMEIDRDTDGTSLPQQSSDSRNCNGLSSLAWRDYTIPYLKAKDLVAIPWMVALALQADGWYLRQDIIWSKPNPMPESVTDRCTKAHEYIFLLSKKSTYFYDAEAIKEPVNGTAHARGDGVNPKARQKTPDGWDTSTGEGGHGSFHRAGREKGHKQRPRQNESFSGAINELVDRRNKRSVWTVATAPFSGWTETARISRVAKDALSDDTTHIVFPGCPEHADLARQFATDVYGEHAAAVLNDIGRIDARLVRALLSGCASTVQIPVSETTRNSLDLLARGCSLLAKLRSNETSKTAPVPETMIPYSAFSEMEIHTADKLTRLVWFALHASMRENSIAPDGSDARLLEGTISRIVNNVSSSCCCQFYQVVKQQTSHFATFPPKLIEPCILAGSRPGDTVLDPFGGSGTTAGVALKHGRKAILCELSEEYAGLVPERIRSITDAVDQPRLFENEDLAPVDQHELF